VTGPAPATGMPPSVHGDGGVLRVLLDRRAAGSRADGHRVALVLGGGGMRGSVVAGMLRALDRAGLAPCFDAVYGSSSGAVSAAAFVTGLAASGAACFPEDLASRRFADLRRLGRRRPALDLDFLVDEVLTARRGLPWERLGHTDVPLHVVATDTADLTAHTLTGMAGPADWRVVLRASAAIPLLAGPPVAWAGRRWIDGSVAEPLALHRAVDGGATHVLALLCRGSADLSPGTGVPVWARALDRVVPGLGTLAVGSRRYAAELRTVTGGTARAHLCAIGPDRPVPAGALTVDPEPVAAAVEIGDAACAAAVEAAAGRSA